MELTSFKILSLISFSNNVGPKIEPHQLFFILHDESNAYNPHTESKILLLLIVKLLSIICILNLKLLFISQLFNNIFLDVFEMYKPEWVLCDIFVFLIETFLEYLIEIPNPLWNTIQLRKFILLQLSMKNPPWLSLLLKAADFSILINELWSKKNPIPLVWAYELFILTFEEFFMFTPIPFWKNLQ